MIINVTFSYEYASGTLSDSKEISFNTPITAYQIYTHPGYFRSDSHTINGFTGYQLGTQSSSAQSLDERSARWSGDLTVTWYIRVWIRHANSTMRELTTGNGASFSRSSGDTGFDLSARTWVCPGRDLDPTDAIIVRVYMKIGATTYGPVNSITIQLNAEKLEDSIWTVWYYTDRSYDSRWNQDRTRGTFYWGDSTYTSRIENFKYSGL